MTLAAVERGYTDLNICKGSKTVAGNVILVILYILYEQRQQLNFAQGSRCSIALQTIEIGKFWSQPAFTPLMLPTF